MSSEAAGPARPKGSTALATAPNRREWEPDHHAGPRVRGAALRHACARKVAAPTFADSGLQRGP
eukprot:6554410-Alexandrium_andersonii.AAC.1